MKTKLVSNHRNTLLIIGLAISVGAYVGDEQLRTYLDRCLPIIGGVPQSSTTHEDKLKQLFPLMANAPIPDSAVLQPGVIPGVSTIPDQGANLHQIFSAHAAKPEASAAAAEPAPPDYFALLKSNQLLKLDATAAGKGAFINGKYIPLGQPIEQFAYPAPAGQGEIAPVLTAITDTTITVSEPRGKRRFVVTMDK